MKKMLDSWIYITLFTLCGNSNLCLASSGISFDYIVNLVIAKDHEEINSCLNHMRTNMIEISHDEIVLPTVSFALYEVFEEHNADMLIQMLNQDNFGTEIERQFCNFLIGYYYLYIEIDLESAQEYFESIQINRLPLSLVVAVSLEKLKNSIYRRTHSKGLSIIDEIEGLIDESNAIEKLDYLPLIKSFVGRFTYYETGKKQDQDLLEECVELAIKSGNHFVIQHALEELIIDKLINSDSSKLDSLLGLLDKEVDRTQKDYVNSSRLKGHYYYLVEQDSLALYHFRKSIDIYQSNSAFYRIHLSSLYVYMNLIFRRQGDFEKALDYCKQAIWAQTNIECGDLSALECWYSLQPSNPNMIRIHNQIGQNLKLKFFESKNFSDLEAAFDLYFHAAQNVNYIKESSNDERSVNHINEARTAINNAIDISLLKFSLVPNEKSLRNIVDMMLFYHGIILSKNSEQKGPSGNEYSGIHREKHTRQGYKDLKNYSHLQCSNLILSHETSNDYLIITISGDDLWLKKLSKNKLDSVLAFLNSRTENWTKLLFDSLAFQNLNQLYTEIFGQNPQLNFKNFILQERGLISKLPFEILIPQIDSLTPSDFCPFLNCTASISYSLNFESNFEIGTIRADISNSLGFSFTDKSSLISQSVNTTLPELPYAVKEIDIIQNMSSSNETIVPSSYNNKNELVQQIQNNYSIIHIASHTSFDPNNYRNNSLFIKNLDDSPLKIEGAEISQLDLQSDLVFLSSCSSSKGFVLNGDGTFSISRNFIEAGCKSVISTRRDISDADAYSFAKEYYKQLSINPVVTESFKEAKISMIEQSLKNRVTSMGWLNYNLNHL